MSYMLTKLFPNKYVHILCVVFTVTLSCTNANREYDSSVLIHVTDTPNRVGMDDYIKIESELVVIDTLPIISEMVDIAQIGNNCYVLDNNKAISCIDMKDGKIIKQKRRIGHSLREFVQPIALATDSSLIYVFDAGSNKMVTMDRNLSIKESTAMPCGFERFTKVDGGYLCYSEYHPAVHFITDSGELTYTHSMANYVVDTSLKSNVFASDEDNNVYIKAEFSDTIFQWANGECVPKYILGFGENSVPNNIKKTSDIWAKHFTFSMDFFVEREKLVFSYIEDHVKRYVCYSTKTGYFSNFSVDSINNTPFLPQWKSGSCYYTFANPEITKLMLKNLGRNNSTLIKYHVSLSGSSAE